MLTQSFVLAALFASSPVLAGKRGVAWPYYNTPLDPALLKSDPVVAIYDWETYQPPSRNANSGLEFIGTQRAMDSNSSPIGELASRAADQGWSTVFTLNEPDLGTTSAADAASWYITYINPLNITKALPSITSSTSSGQGLDWLANFISACGGACDYDYINLHWYGTSFGEFQSYIEGAHAIYPNTPFVITEFALTNPAGGADDQLAFFTSAFQWLDAQDYIHLYFPFVATSPFLLTNNGAAGYVGTGSCLYNNVGALSSIGNLMTV